MEPPSDRRLAARAPPSPPHRSVGRELAPLAALVLAAACSTPRSQSGAIPDPSATPVSSDPSSSAQDAAPPASSPAPQAPGPQELVEPRVEGEAKPKKDDAGPPISGSLISRYRRRWSGDAHDQDLYETLVLDAGDAQKDPFTAHFVGRATGDLDGLHDADSQQVFPSLADARDGAVQGWLYEAYVDFHHPPGLATMRVGRQIDYTTPEFAHFDGVSATTKASQTWRAFGGAYGGVPVRMYDATTTANAIYGLWGEAQPWKDGRVRADWMHVDDDTDFGRHHDDLMSLSGWQRAGEKAHVDGSYSRLENRDRDLRLRATWDDPELDFTAQVDFYKLLSTQKDFADEFDPFFTTLFTFFPYSQYGLRASKGIGDQTRIEGGLDLRRVSDSSDEGTFNRDYERGWGSLVLLDRFWEHLVITLTADLWNSDERDIQTWGLDLTREWPNGLEVSLGSSYALYKYDLFSNSERDDVRVYYLKGDRKISEAWTFELGYAFEDDDGDPFHSLLLGAIWHF